MAGNFLRRRVRRRPCEERDRGMEFQVIGPAENFIDSTARDTVDQGRTFDEPLTEDGVQEVSARLV